LLTATGQLDEARGRLDTALQLADGTGMRFYDAELLRLRARTHTDPDARRADLAAALDLARRQGATLFELRAALDDFELRGQPARAALRLRPSQELRTRRSPRSSRTLARPSRWSESVDRKITDIFAVQSEIASTVAEKMSVQVATSAPAPGGTRDVEAYEHYLQGQALFNLAKDESSDRSALTNFETAIAGDPRFALAHAGRSRTLAVIAGEHATADQVKPLYAAAVAAARQAIEIAPDLAEGHLALGYATFAGQLNVRGAWPSYQRAYSLGYGNADIALLYALYCSRAGRPAEAKAAVERAVLLDPLNARAFRAEGSVAYAGRRYADALAPLRRALQLNPKMTFAHSLLGNSLLELGRTGEAVKEFEAEPDIQFRLTGLAIAERRQGNQPAADKAFADLQSQVGDAAVYQQAEVLAQWGRAAEAFQKLGRALEVGDSGLTYAPTDVMLDPIRRDQRFARIIKALNA